MGVAMALNTVHFRTRVHFFAVLSVADSAGGGGFRGRIDRFKSIIAVVVQNLNGKRHGVSGHAGAAFFAFDPGNLDLGIVAPFCGGNMAHG